MLLYSSVHICCYNDNAPVIYNFKSLINKKLVFLSKSKLRGRKAGRLKTRLGFDNGLHVESEGKSGGLIQFLCGRMIGMWRCRVILGITLMLL